jgi:hypothetical protein
MGAGAGPPPPGAPARRENVSCRWHCPSGFGMMLFRRHVPTAAGFRERGGKQEKEMKFDPDRFLTHYADAFNGRDPEKLRAFFALDDPRFAVFEDFSEELIDGETYGVVLEGAFDATSEMSFDLLRCDRFGDFAIIHAIQKVVDEHGGDEGVFMEAKIRATMCVLLSGEEAQVIAAHFSCPSPSADADCFRCMCSG